MKKLLIALAVATTTLVAANKRGLDPASLYKPLGESWPVYSGDYSGKRYSSLTQINQGNVKNLTLAWTRRRHQRQHGRVPSSAASGRTSTRAIPRSKDRSCR